MSHLFSTLIVKGITIPNRIVFPPMANNMAGEDGAVSDAHVEHYARRARGGAGLVVVEHSYIRLDGRINRRQLGIHHDDLVPGLKRVVDAVKRFGTVVGIQITHAGARTQRAIAGGQPVAPSDGVFPAVAKTAGRAPDIARALTGEEMDQLVLDYVAAARRAVQAGFDFVEVHGAHGFLLSQFLSPLANRRQDEYGGVLANRLRFPVQVVEAVRREMGDDGMLLYRLGGNDFLEGGLTQAEGQEAGRVLVAAGVDILDISGGLCGDVHPGWDGKSQGYFVPMAAGIRAAVNVPVIVAGGITQPEYADDLVQRGWVDLVAIGRAMMANPDWAAQARAALGGQ